MVGGGPAATWAALKSAQAGAEVVLADKGYCGTSGATASGGIGVPRRRPLRRPADLSPAGRRTHRPRRGRS
ncbi:FAD-binding protein [Streptomyces tubercidicus]